MEQQKAKLKLRTGLKGEGKRKWREQCVFKMQQELANRDQQNAKIDTGHTKIWKTASSRTSVDLGG